MPQKWFQTKQGPILHIMLNGSSPFMLHGPHESICARISLI